jgi:hypothetical protein
MFLTNDVSGYLSFSATHCASTIANFQHQSINSRFILLSAHCIFLLLRLTGTNILLLTPSSNNHTLHSFLRIKDKVSHLHKTMCKIINSLLHLQAADRNSYKTSHFHHRVNENCTLLGSYTACSGTTRCIIARKGTVLKIILP